MDFSIGNKVFSNICYESVDHNVKMVTVSCERKLYAEMFRQINYLDGW